MTHTHGYARNKEQDMLEGAENSLAHPVSRIASASGRIRAFSQISSAHRNAATCDMSLFQRYLRSVSEQILSSQKAR